MRTSGERECLECGGTTKIVKKDYRFAESGLDNVILKDLEVVVCPKCKTESPRIPRMNDLMRTIAIALIAKPYKLEGQDVRFLRKFLGLTNERFNKLLDIDKAHLSRVENGAIPVSDQADRLIRLVALGLGDNLEEKARTIINQFEQITPAPKKMKMIVGPGMKSYEYKAA